MARRLSFQEVKAAVAEVIPNDIEYSVDLEAATIAIITKDPKRFGRGDGLVGKIAKKVRRRVIVRPDPEILLSEEDAELKIRELVPEEAGLTDVWFDGAYSEVLIECTDPGTAVGPKGKHLKAIRDAIGWLVSIDRAPPLPCRTVSDIRRYRRDTADERRALLRRFGQNIFRPQRPGSTWVRVTALGSYREVGRACHLITTNESRILVDVGVNIASDTDPMPYFNAPEVLPLESLDAVVLTHAHLDHAGMLPVLFKYGYSGPIFCTPPTRDMAMLLQTDYLKVGSAEGKRPPFDMAHVRQAVKHVVDVNWNETTDIAPDIKLTFYNAGHILGSSSVHLHIGEGAHNLVLSGDMKYEKSWLFDAANVRFPRVETLVVESTYGAPGDFQPSRQEATQELQDTIVRTLQRSGKVLVPVFAVGRSQEVMIAIDELFRSGEIKPCTVWLDGMIQEATAIHAAHPNYLTSALRTSILRDSDDNPFTAPWFKSVEGHEMRESVLLDPAPAIVLATSGMMNGGPVMEYFKQWAPLDTTTLCFVGYQAEGTLGRRLQKGFSEVPLADRGRTTMVKVQCDMVTIDGFSGHSDRRQLIDYVEQMTPRPRTIICHHGDIKKCNELGQALKARFKVRTHAPKNLETVRLV